ncbi:uncharacterized protein [Arachis hypogaea]|uniref:uncharacterized protein n=1 Tax=Arachis hypogaea TaxID=3818 RepID=UPI003B224A90
MAPRQLRYLIVTIDYYTKWIEAEPLASIIAAQCQKFFWRHFITRFGVLEIVISDNGTQFVDRRFKEFLKGLCISHLFSSVEHPQINGQVESANKIIGKGETPFRLTYGLEAVIPIEVGDPNPRRTVGGNNEEAERDFTDEVKSVAYLRELALKQRISLRYNRSLIQWDFGSPTPGEGKLTPKWEGPYRIKAVIGKGAYKLERLNGDEVPRTWNAANLRRYYA